MQVSALRSTLHFWLPAAFEVSSLRKRKAQESSPVPAAPWPHLSSQKEVTFHYTLSSSSSQPNPWGAFQRAKTPLKSSLGCFSRHSKVHCNSNENVEIHSLGQAWEIITEVKHLLKVATGFICGDISTLWTLSTQTQEQYNLHMENVLSPGH